MGGMEALQLLRFDDTFDGSLRFEELLCRHTTFKIGGSAYCWVEVSSITALSQVLSACRQEGLPWVVIGKGSNLLVSDRGYEGVVITLGRDFRSWNFDAGTLQFTVGAAATLSRIVQEAFHQGVSGLEFAVGTPGTVGGALRMNAGSRIEGLGDHVVSVTVYSPDRGLVKHFASSIEWGYRTSSLPKDEIIVECVLAMQLGQEGHIRARMEGSLARRKRSQPLEYPSCGSVFKNPEGCSVGELIEQSGLKGMCVGGAQISEKHGNFIINRDNASAADVVELMQKIQDKVAHDHGIELQPEVRFLGFAQ